MDREENSRKRRKLTPGSKPIAEAAPSFDIGGELQNAMRYHRSGQFQRAKEIYNRILKVNPQHGETLHLLGVMAYQFKKYETAAALIGKAIEIDPNQAIYYTNMGNVLNEQAQSDRAVTCYQKALQLNPNLVEAHYNLGNTLDRQGKLDEAIVCYQKTLQINPNYVEGHNNLGNILNKQGKLDQAIACYQKAIQLNPNYTNAYNNLGAALHKQDKLDQAIACYQKALQINPNNSNSHNNMGVSLYEQSKLDQAITCYQKALQFNPDNADAHNNLGILLNEQNKPDQAIACYQKVLQLKPDYADAYNNMGSSLSGQGESDQAVACFQKALQLNPNCAGAHKNLANCKKFHEGDKSFEILESLKGKYPYSLKEKMSIHFALGKMYADIADYEKSFENYRSANELRKQRYGQNFDLDDCERHFRECMEIFDEVFFASRRHFGIDSEVPVFIVGMPRSGTTLVEQILASHRQVFGAGELKEVSLFFSNFAGQNPGKTFRQVIELLDDSVCATLAGEYLDHICSLSEDAVRITDKMPHNFKNLWFITLLFPKARVIHCRRDRLDTCLSCYFQDFREVRGFKNDLRVLGLYYRLYEQLMDHWQRVLPIPILDVQYEELVGDQEQVSRKMVEFCGLEWDDNCLEFHKNKRFVRTSSTMQVRQKIYNTSIGKWKNYADFLGPLMEALECENRSICQ